MKVSTSAAYWTVGLGAFALLVLVLWPPKMWANFSTLGHSDGRVVDSNVHDSWKSRRMTNVVMVADAPMTRTTTRAPVAQTRKPSCMRWHKVKRGQTQWFLANAYNNQKNKQLWLKGMRQISGKRHNDDSLQVGETICVRWR